MSASREQEFRLGAERGDTPLLPSERVWGFWGFAYANSALAVATWVFLIGGATALFVGPLQGIAAIIIGNIIGVVLAASSTCLPCGKYGVEQFTFLRSMFGLNGSRLVYFLSVVVLTMGWLAVLGLMCGRALDNLQTLVHQAQPSGDGWLVTAGALLAIVLAALVAMRGPDMIRRLSAVIAPSLILIMLALMYFISRRYSLDQLLAMPPLQPPFENPHVNFMVAVEINIAAGFSWWPYIGNLSRLCSNQRTAFWPNLVGIFGAASLGESVSLFAATTLGSSDPTAWMRLAGGMGFGIIALSFLALANLTGMVNILYTAVIGLRQLAGERLRSMGWGVLISLFCIIPVVIVVLLPGIYDGFFIFLVWTSALNSALAGIGIADYFFLRKQRLNLRQLYAEPSVSPLRYCKGFNPIALVALVAGFAIYVVVFNPQTLAHTDFFTFATASLPSCLLAGLVHYGLTRLLAARLGWGGYPKRNERNIEAVGLRVQD
ncbi:TPA: cytosine permease [Pseudomonas putida]|uniref:Permease for cytosine/purines uracil thiamine allantoin n=1 Tax=Pseudomonas putida (strain GB-1) TaxID=76869 RepID=B0KGJ1_PSEPG|nr:MULTISPECIES: cytosine permease [Pseudomonas]ABY98992.1 permease for cytosine/purines uracil thiamine allantoin [Pseudomonas putida GB-1]APE99230.1 thiamine permease [Pseudomonas putida]MBP0708800.1 cytosine permease [Pseudomonas sp. T34]MCE1001024.1 cytosine permease [Pseudomonas sp. NMI1173_11]MCK2188238.1 cytosine permease [Pseudomonas sp. MB04B]